MSPFGLTGEILYNQELIYKSVVYEEFSCIIGTYADNNSALRQTTPHHAIIDCFPIFTVHPVVFYSLYVFQYCKG